MGWVNDALKELAAGRVARVRPQGGSMRGRIESRQLVAVGPVAAGDVRVDDIVLVGWKGSYLLHLVTAIDKDRIQIGNNLGKINGWVTLSAVRGKVVAVGDAAQAG